MPGLINWGAGLFQMGETVGAQNGALPPYSDYDPCGSGFGYPVTPLPEAILTN